MSLYESATRTPGTTGDHDGDQPPVLTGTVVPGPFRKASETDGDHFAGQSSADLAVPAGTAIQTTMGAAFVAARKVGTAVVWTSGGAWTLLRWTGHGTRATTALAWRYVRAHDQQEAIGGVTSKADWKSVHATRHSRWKFLGYSALSVAVADLVSWWAMAKYAHVPALEWESWATAPGLECSLALAGLAAYGRYRVNAGLAAGEFVAPEDMEEEDENEPYPLAHCVRADEAVDCLNKAMYAENLHVRHIEVTRRFGWGWEYSVDLRGTTVAKVNQGLAALEAHMNLPTGGFHPEADPQASAHLMVRTVVSDPFADMPRPAVHAPNSLSIHNVIDMGRAMDGGRLDILLDGFFALVVGAMGAGKTLGALRTLAEAITACVDAIAWDLDPIKDGLSEFGGLMDKRGRGVEECEELLAKGSAYVRARAQIFRTIGMGDRWKASPKHPALFIFVDEVTLLSPQAKKDLVDILRTGRQLGVWLIIAGQEATEDALGDAIGGIIAYRIALSCRPEDVRIVFGPGKAALGWRPDRLVPSTGVLANDAGKSYIMGGAFTRPIQYRFNAYSIDQIKDAVAERLAAGRPSMDADTRRAAGEDVTDDGRDLSLADRLEALHAQGGVHDAAIVAELLRLYGAKGEPFLPTALLTEQVADYTTADDKPIDADRLGRLLRAHAPGVSAVRQPWDGQQQTRGWLREDVERAGRGLIDPSKARQGAV